MCPGAVLRKAQVEQYFLKLSSERPKCLTLPSRHQPKDALWREALICRADALQTIADSYPWLVLGETGGGLYLFVERARGPCLQKCPGKRFLKPSPPERRYLSSHVWTQGRAGGAVLASGVTEIEDCIFSGNNAPVGPAVSNVLTVEINNTEFSDNTLWCDDNTLFLDWKNVSDSE